MALIALLLPLDGIQRVVQNAACSRA